MNDWPLWEVFIRSKGGLAHRHVGSVHAPDEELAIRHARDTYTRRQEGVSLWVVRSEQIVASDPDEAGELFEPGAEGGHPRCYPAWLILVSCAGTGGTRGSTFPRRAGSRGDPWR